MRLARSGAIALIALTAAPAQAANPPLSGPPGVSDSKVLVIGTDGTRIDLVDKVIAQGGAPNLLQIRKDGFVMPSLLAYEPPEAATISEVGWSSVASGVWPDKHTVRGALLNMDPRQKTKNGYHDFLTRIEQERPQLSTFLVSHWANIGLEESGGPIFGGGDARSAVSTENTIEAWDSGDQSVADVAARYLRNGNPDAGFVYLGVVDEVAHLDGSANPRYLQAIRDTDRRIGQMLAAIRARPTYLEERWLVIVTTDHGQRHLTTPSTFSHGFGSDLERTSFVAAAGFGLNEPAFSDIRIVDIAPTVLARLGIPVDPRWNLDGRPFSQAPGVPDPAAKARRLSRKRLRVVVSALQGAEGLRRVQLKLPRGVRVRAVKAAPAGALKVTRRRVRFTTADLRKVRLRIRVKRRSSKTPLRRVRVLITDDDGKRTTLRPRVRR